MNAAATTRLTADERREEIVAAALHAFADGGLHRNIDRDDRPGRRAYHSRTCSSCSARSGSCSWPWSGTDSSGPAGYSTRRRAAARPTTRSAASLTSMGKAYMQMLSDTDLLRVQLQAYAACGDDDVRQVVREEFAALYLAVKEDSGASNEEIHHFFAEGMLLNVAAALELGGTRRPGRSAGCSGPRHLWAGREAPAEIHRPAAPFFAAELSDH